MTVSSACGSDDWSNSWQTTIIAVAPPLTHKARILRALFAF